MTPAFRPPPSSTSQTQFAPVFGPPPPPVQSALRDDFDIHVPIGVRSRIAKGKYIEMCDVLKDDPRKRGSYFVNRNYESSSDEEADNNINNKSKKGKQARCLSEEEWREAFSIFGFILTQVQPEVAPGLFIHQSAVMTLMSQKADWNFFDVTIRKLICRGKRQWGEECLKEFLEAKAAKSHVQKNANKFEHKFDKALMVPKGFCVNYHKNGKCVETKESRCAESWFHICFKCMGPDPHRASLCNAPSKQSFRGRGRGRPNRK